MIWSWSEDAHFNVLVGADQARVGAQLPLAHDGRLDQLVGEHLVQQLVVDGLVDEDQVAAARALERIKTIIFSFSFFSMKRTSKSH